MDNFAPDRASDSARVPLVPFNNPGNMPQGASTAPSSTPTTPKNPSVLKTPISTKVTEIM